MAGDTPHLTDIISAVFSASMPLRRFLRTNQINIVHTNDLRTHLTWPLAAQLAGARVITHQRVILSRSPFWRVLASGVHRIVCISDAVYNSLPRNGQSKAIVVPNPVDMAQIPASRSAASAALRERLGLAKDVRLVGYVGNMTRQKRPLVFLRASALLKQIGDVHFVLVGDNRGGELDAAKSLARQLGLSDVVHFMGFQMPVEPIVAGFDLLIAPGVNEAFGRTVAEAMSAGTPVVAAASGGHIELLENGRFGLLALPDDEVSIASSASSLLENEALRDRFARAAKNKADLAFSLTAHIEHLSNIYDSLSC